METWVPGNVEDGAPRLTPQEVENLHVLAVPSPEGNAIVQYAYPDGHVTLPCWRTHDMALAYLATFCDELPEGVVVTRMGRLRVKGARGTVRVTLEVDGYATEWN